MSHLIGCPMNWSLYGSCTCDQIRMAVHTEALARNTQALSDHTALQAEVENLRAELAEAKLAGGKMERTYNAEFLRLERELAEAKLDSARLDWMFANLYGPLGVKGFPPGSVATMAEDRPGLDRKIAFWDKERAARAQSGAPERKGGA